MLKSPTRMLAPPPGLRMDSDLGSSADSADSENDSTGSSPLPMLLGAKPALKRKDTFYDKDYEGVKVSNVPKTMEGWMFFMDLLKAEHRKFKLLLTHLRIEKMKILKEFEAFTSAIQDAKNMVKLQFETSMTDLKAVNIARLLNGEVNKRSSSFIKTTPSKQRRNNAVIPKTSHSITSALSSVREAFGDFDENETDGFADGGFIVGDPNQSVKLSTPSERANRPKIAMEHEENAILERKNKLRKKSTVPTFNVSTQTVQIGAVAATPTVSAASRLDKFRKDTALAEQFQYHARPHALSQPFLGFIRKHEKTYAREIGLMRIALREFKGLYDLIKQHLDRVMVVACPDTVAPELLQALQQLHMLFSDGAWVFDAKFFIRKVEMNPLEDPLDVAAQANIIASYQEAAQQTQQRMVDAQLSNDTQAVTQLKEVQTELNNLLTDLNNRARERGGWRALLYTTKGEVDMDMNIAPWKPEEQVQILQEKLRYALQKQAESEKNHEQVVKQLHETLEAVHSKHRPALYANAKHRNSVSAPPPTAAAGHAGTGRSMSVSSSSGAARVQELRAHSAHSNQHDSHEGPSHGHAHPPHHRHTLAHVGGSTGGTASRPQAALVGIAAELHDSSEPALSHRSATNPPSAAPSPRTADHSSHHSAEAPTAGMAPAVQQELEGIFRTMQMLHSSLEASRTQQEQQQEQIRQLHEVILKQREQLEAFAHARDKADKESLGLDADSSLLSQPSQDIIDEYKQIGSRPNSPERQHPAALPAQKRPFSAAHAVPGGNAGVTITTQARRGSVLVQHRDTGQLEYVPVGKIGTAHNLRISVNNELRDHKHLLLRPTSAMTPPSGSTRTFASILAGTAGSPKAAPGSKAPVNKIAQMEAIKRQEKALHVLHHGKPVPPIMSGGLMPLNANMSLQIADSAKMVTVPVPTIQPPSPQNVRRMSANTMVQELSAIMDDEVTASTGNTHRSGEHDGGSGGAHPIAPAPATRVTVEGPGQHGPIPSTPEDMVASIKALGEKLQDSLVLLSAALNVGQELLAGVDDVRRAPVPAMSGDADAHSGDGAELYGLRIGESAIDLDRSEDAADRRQSKRSPTSHDLPPLSPPAGGGKGILQQQRPKTAGHQSGSRDSYEDLFSDALAGSTATQKHSDVSIYATTLQNRYLHHVQEAKKIEDAIKRLGRAHEADAFEHQQETAHAHYASMSLFRPQSAAPSLAGGYAHDPHSLSSSTHSQGSGAVPGHRSTMVGNRAHSASAAHGHTAAISAAVNKKRGVTAVPFAKVKPGSAGHLDGTGGMDAGGAQSPRLQELSAELSNLSEHEL